LCHHYCPGVLVPESYEEDYEEFSGRAGQKKKKVWTPRTLCPQTLKTLFFFFSGVT